VVSLSLRVGFFWDGKIVGNSSKSTDSHFDVSGKLHA